MTSITFSIILPPGTLNFIAKLQAVTRKQRNIDTKCKQLAIEYLFILASIIKRCEAAKMLQHEKENSKLNPKINYLFVKFCFQPTPFVHF